MNGKRDLFIKCYLLLSLIVCLGGEEVNKEKDLEFIWEKSRENSIEMKTAFANKKIANKNLNNYLRKYIPTFLVYTSSSFNVDEENWLNPEEIYSYLEIQENLPDGGILNVIPKINVSRNIWSYIDKSESEKFEKDFEINISYTKNINFSNIKEINGKIDLNYLDLQKKETEILQNIEFLNCIKNVSGNYLEYRKNIRNLDSINEILNFLMLKKSALKLLQSEGKTSQSIIYEIEEEIFDLEKNQKELRFDLETIFNNLKKFVGVFDSEFYEKIDFFCELPEIKKVFEENPSVTECILQREILGMNEKINIRNYSPKFSIGTTLPVTKSESIIGTNWNVIVSLDFSPYIERFSRNEKEDYRIYDELYEEKLKNVLRQCEKDQQYYKELKSVCEKQLERYAKIISAKRNTIKDYEELYNRGKCSYLDFLEVQCYMKTIENEIENLKDDMWYFEWMEINS